MILCEWEGISYLYYYIIILLNYISLLHEKKLIVNW
jgi:hypothetical protein